jgi:hypothetical protein
VNPIDIGYTTDVGIQTGVLARIADIGTSSSGGGGSVGSVGQTPDRPKSLLQVNF